RRGVGGRGGGPVPGGCAAGGGGGAGGGRGRGQGGGWGGGGPPTGRAVGRRTRWGGGPAHRGDGGVAGGRVGRVVGQVHVPQRASVVVPHVVPGDLRADRELQQQRVQQVHGEGLVAAVRRLEDRAEPSADRAETRQVGLGRAACRGLVGPEQTADRLDGGQRVLAPGRLLGVDETDGVIR